MKEVILTDEDMKILSGFVHDMSDINDLEGIYLQPFDSDYERFEIIKVNLVFGSSFNGRLLNHSETEISEEDQKFFSLYKKYCDLAKNTRLRFEQLSLSDYEKDKKGEVLSRYWQQMLVAGEIIYDKQGSLKAKQEEFSQKLSNSCNSMVISNIDELRTAINDRQDFNKYVRMLLPIINQLK